MVCSRLCSSMTLCVCLWMVIQLSWQWRVCAAQAEMSFLTLGTTPRVQTQFLLRSENSVSDPIGITTTFPFGNTTVTEAHVSENGLISFTGPISQPPRSVSLGFFPDTNTNSYIVAPFWSDNDIRDRDRRVSYEVYTNTVSTHEERLASVSQFITNETGNAFNGAWMLLVTWDGCHPFPYGSNTMTTDTYLQQSNTYQAIVITDGSSQSYAVFIYECDTIEWGGRNSIFARVGIRVRARDILHPLSGNDSVSDIDCVNEMTTPWVNIVYDLVNIRSSPSTGLSSSTTLTTFTPQASTFVRSSMLSIETIIQSTLTNNIGDRSTTQVNSNSLTLSTVTSISPTNTRVATSNIFTSGSISRTSEILMVSRTLTSAPPTEADKESSSLAVTVGLISTAAVVLLVAVVIMTAGLLAIMYQKHHNKVKITGVKGEHENVTSSGLHTNLFVVDKKTPNHEGVLLLEDSYQF